MVRHDYSVMSNLNEYTYAKLTDELLSTYKYFGCHVITSNMQ